MSQKSSKIERTEEENEQPLRAISSLFSKELEVKSEDIIAYTTLMSVMYLGIKHTFTIKAMKSIDLNDGIQYFLSADKIVFDYWNIFPMLLLYSTVVAIGVCFIFGAAVDILRKNADKIDSFVSDKGNFKYTLGVGGVFCGLMLWGNPIAPVAVIVFALFMFKMRILIRFSIINVLVLAMFAGYAFSTPSDTSSAEKPSKDEIVSVTLVGESPQNAEIIASLTDWLLLEIDDREILIPTSQIQKIDLGKRSNSKD